MAELFNSDTQTVHDVLPKMSRSGRFNMAQLFLAGISLDTQSQWIEALREAIQQNKVLLFFFINNFVYSGKMLVQAY